MKMYFRHLYYDENNNVISLELECDICSNRIEIELPDNNISEATDEYCVVNVEIIAKVEKLDIIMLHNIAEKVDTLMLLM
jgi:hypothetical protein